MDHTHIIQPDDLQTGKKGYLFILRPFCFYHAMAIIGHQPCGIRAIGAVNFQSLSGGNKSKHIITGDGFAAIGKRIHDLVTAFAKNDQFRIFFSWQMRQCSVCVSTVFIGFRWFKFIAQDLEIFQFFKINFLNSNLIKQIKRGM